MKGALDILDKINFGLISQPLAFTPETKVAILLSDWEKISEYIEYLQDVERHYDEVMEVVGDMPVDIDDIIGAFKSED